MTPNYIFIVFLMYVGVCVHERRHAHIVWKPEINTACLPRLIRTLFEKGSRIELKALLFSQTSWPESPSDPPVSASHVQGSQT